MLDPSLAPIFLHEEISGNPTTMRDHAWIFDIKHDCGGSDYSDPANAGYINQYDAGDALDLPTSHGEKSGNSCGPSSFTMLVDAFKRATHPRGISGCGDGTRPVVAREHGLVLERSQMS